jgi:hypothetical protein
MQIQSGLFSKLVEELWDASGALNEESVRDEPFDAGQFELRAARVAAEHEVAEGGGHGWLLLPRFVAHRQSLLTAYSALLPALQDGRELTPVAVRLANNFHLVEEQLQIVGQRLTSRYYRNLPKIGRGPLTGYPRVYGVALSYMTHASCSLDAEKLKSYLRAYQSAAALTIGEVRALELTLRLVLVEKLSRLAAHVVGAEAEVSADRLSELAESIFASVASLSAFDWRELFKEVCVVDTILCEDPAGTYSSMDVDTQDSYRRVVERVAKRSGASEAEVARQSVGLTAGVHGADAHERTHVGYFLIDGGLPELEEVLGYRPGLAERAARAALRHPTPTYLLAYAGMTALLVACYLVYALHGGGGWPALVVVSLLSLVPASEMVTVGLRLVLMKMLRPRRLPRMDTSSGIPNDAPTMVVVPTLFSSEAAVRDSLETIEAHYLANQDGKIFFGLLADWAAAPREEMPGDAALLAAALGGIEELNARYDDGSQGRFHLFHRRRMWNESEGEWIGWEKKRGKLREFNRLLRGARDTSYTTCTADPALLGRIRYVISLDSDTQLPRDGARKLVGTILHPLNRPRLDGDANRVTRGYGILQPLVSVPPPRAGRARVPRILSGYHGINPYTRPAAAAAPNVYQDLFAEGNYVGKALYDVDAFEAALKDRVPENTLLSHDLLEGLYARTALVDDVEIFDHPPSHYVAHCKRAHRWTRGDWQLLPWLLPRVRDARGHYARNVLPAIGRWKILDNLRRSLSAPATFLWLVAAWTVLPGSPYVWTGLILVTLAAPAYLHFTAELLTYLNRNREAAFLPNARAIYKIATGQALYSMAYLAHQAYLMSDAIVRTLYRLLISRRRLLEWVTAAQAQKESTLSPRLFARFMWPALALALAVGVALAAVGGAQALPPASLLLLAWFSSPLLAYGRSRRMQGAFDALEENVERDVRFDARYTWRFFESSVASAPAPGLLQVAPAGVAALGATPAGLARLQLWTVAAYELGAVGTLELAERLESVFDRVENLRDAHGAFGDTGLRASSASGMQHVLVGEMGNLAGFLRALKQDCVEVTSRPLFDERSVSGLTDTVLLMKYEFLSVKAATPGGEVGALFNHLSDEIEMCLAFLRAARRGEAPRTIREWHRFFTLLGQRAAIFEVLLDEFSQKYPAVSIGGPRYWADYLARQARELSRELCLFAPWVWVSTAHVEPIIRRRCAPALALWGRVVEGLDRPSSLSRLPEELDLRLIELAGLRDQLSRVQPVHTVECEAALRWCDELRNAIEEACRASNEALSRYARLAHRSRATADATDFRSLFDEEYRLLRSQFQVSMTG